MGLASPTHLIILLVILLLLFGAKKIPELAKGLGQGMKEFKKGQQDEEVNSGDTHSRSVEGERAEAPRATVNTEERSTESSTSDRA